MWKDKNFWFSQPTISLNNYDQTLLWVFGIMFGLGLLIKLLLRFAKHPVWVKLANKFSNLFLYSGLMGLIWFGFRYETTPVFSHRYWAALAGIIFLIWLFFIIKYSLTGFILEKKNFDKMQLNSRYIPGSKK